MRRIAAVFTVLAILAVGLAGANLVREPGGVALDWQIVKPPALEVIVEPASLGSIVQTVSAPGKVESVEEAKIASQLIGRVVAVEIKEGDVVKQGDVLVRLDETDAKARLDSSIARIDRLRSGIEQAQKDLEKAERDAGQSSKLAGRGFTTPTELADARTALAKSLAALAMSQNELVESEAMKRTATKELERTVIRAPIDGVISGIDVDVGEIVIAGTTNLPGSVLMTVCDLSKMRIRADVDETDVPRVRHGQPVRIHLQADPMRPIPGRVAIISAKGTIKQEVVSFETLVAVERERTSSSKEPELRPGMTTTVEIEVQRAEEALGVPAQAVVHRRRKDLPDSPEIRSWAKRNSRGPSEQVREADARYVKIVFVLRDGQAKALPVETGLSDERRVEILSGLEPDDQVIIGPFRALDELKDGQAVQMLAPPTDPGKAGKTP